MDTDQTHRNCESANKDTNAYVAEEVAKTTEVAKKSRWNRKEKSKETQNVADGAQTKLMDIAEGPEVDIAMLLRIGPVGEEATRAENARSVGGNKGKLAKMAYETLQMVEAGGFHSLDLAEWVDLRSPVHAAVRASVHHASDLWHPGSLPPPAFSKASIEVRCCTCLAAAHELALSPGNESAPGVLNFASARNPGGGFSTGASAQEESIARSSALYPCLTKHFDAFFVPNRLAQSGAYTHDIIYSPKVPVIRGDEGQLLTPWYQADFLTCAAPNLGVLRQRHAKGQEAEQIANESLKERIARILHLFAKNGAVDLVLGAWGCGVFKNSPETVASLFREQLNGTFRGRFRCVIFAVLDPQMAQVFADTFGTELGGLGRNSTATQSSGSVSGSARRGGNRKGYRH